MSIEDGLTIEGIKERIRLLQELREETEKTERAQLRALELRYKTEEKPAEKAPEEQQPHNPLAVKMREDIRKSRTPNESGEEFANPFLAHIGRGIAESRPDLGKALIEAARRKEAK